MNKMKKEMSTRHIIYYNTNKMFTGIYWTTTLKTEESSFNVSSHLRFPPRDPGWDLLAKSKLIHALISQKKEWIPPEDTYCSRFPLGEEKVQTYLSCISTIWVTIVYVRNRGKMTSTRETGSDIILKRAPDILEHAEHLL
jgi:hypothetical protein